MYTPSGKFLYTAQKKNKLKKNCKWTSEKQAHVINLFCRACVYWNEIGWHKAKVQIYVFLAFKFALNFRHTTYDESYFNKVTTEWELHSLKLLLLLYSMYCTQFSCYNSLPVSSSRYRYPPPTLIFHIVYNG